MRRLILAWLTAAFSAVAAAQTDQPADYRDVPNVYQDQYRVNADASYDLISMQTRIIRDQNDVQNNSLIGMQFIASLQTAEVLEAYVLKLDGTKVKVNADQVAIKDAPGANGFADFGDNKVIQVLFPNVNVGDRIYAKLHLTSKALFPGRFSYFTEHDPLGFPYQASTVIEAPQSLGLVAKARGAVKLTQQSQAGQVKFTLQEGHETFKVWEPEQVCPCDYSGAASVNNFKDWADVARAYRERAADKATVTPAIQELAKNLVGQKTGLDAVKAIDTWVRSNVRYVQVYLDAGGYVPHSADSILRNKYGDCKDYVTLEQALLKAVGIDAEPVLVGVSYRFKEIPVPGPEQFDHAILYVPKLNVYLDPTNRFAPLGAYQQPLAGKPVLHTTTGVLKRFPVAAALANTLLQTSNMTLLPDGSVVGNMRLRTTGTMNSLFRNLLAMFPSDQVSMVVQGTLTNLNEPGSGSLTLVNQFSDAGQDDLTATWTSPKLVNVEDVTSFSMPEGFTVLPITGMLQLISLESRITPMFNGASTLHKVTTLTIPSEWKVMRLPKNVQESTPNLSYSITYRLEGSKITAEQVITIKNDVLQPQDYAAYRAGVQAAVKAAKSTILLEVK